MQIERKLRKLEIFCLSVSSLRLTILEKFEHFAAALEIHMFRGEVEVDSNRVV